MFQTKNKLFATFQNIFVHLSSTDFILDYDNLNLKYNTIEHWPQI